MVQNSSNFKERHLNNISKRKKKFKFVPPKMVKYGTYLSILPQNLAHFTYILPKIWDFENFSKNFENFWIFFSPKWCKKPFRGIPNHFLRYLYSKDTYQNSLNFQKYLIRRLCYFKTLKLPDYIMAGVPKGEKKESF